MRRFRLFVPSKSIESELPGQAEVLPPPEDLLTIAKEYIDIGKKTIEPILKDPTTVIVVTDDLKMALFALKAAAELYEKIKAWDEAVFAWAMLEAVPVDSELKWGAAEKVRACELRAQKKLVPHPPSRQAR